MIRGVHKKDGNSGVISPREASAASEAESPFNVALVIEPEMLPRLALRHQLLLAGITVVHEAEDGEDGMAYLSSRGVEIVFTGWEPGGVTCLQIMKTLRGRSRSPRIPVVLMDWGLPQATIVAAVKAGIAGRMVMPTTPKKVRQALQDVIGALASAKSNHGAS